MNENINDFFEPTNAIVVYHRAKDQEFYLENHPVQNNTWGAGSPLKVETLSAMVSLLAKKEKKGLGYLMTGLLPAGVLLVNPAPGQEQLVWYRPPMVRNLTFGENLSIPNGLCHLPALVFWVRTYTLMVYAIQGNADLRPDENTLLCHAPFHNTATYNRGTVCMGSSQKGKVVGVTIPEAIHGWERAFFMSEFNQTQGQPVKSNLNLIYRDIVNTQKPFPQDELVFNHYQLGDLMNGTKRKQR